MNPSALDDALDLNDGSMRARRAREHSFDAAVSESRDLLNEATRSATVRPMCITCWARPTTNWTGDLAN